jgi:hypothetical protein
MIEIPDAYHAAGYFDPITDPNDPIVSSNGFEAFDPSTNGADPATTVGGFTQVDVGQYILKTIEGADPLEAGALFMPFSPGALVQGVYVPNGIPGIPATYNDGKSISVVAVDPNTQSGVDTPFYCHVFRFFTGLQTLATGPTPP